MRPLSEVRADAHELLYALRQQCLHLENLAGQLADEGFPVPAVEIAREVNDTKGSIELAHDLAAYLDALDAS